MRGRTSNTQRENKVPGYATGGTVSSGTSASAAPVARAKGGSVTVSGKAARPSLARPGRKMKRADGGEASLPDTELERRVRDEPLGVGNPKALAGGAGAATAAHMALRSRWPGAVRAVLGGLGTGTAYLGGRGVVDDYGGMVDASRARTELRRRERDGAAEGHGLKARAKGGSVKGKNWIAGAVGKNPGALHKALRVPMGDKIPAAKIDKASHSDNPKLARQANLAKTLKGFK